MCYPVSVDTDDLLLIVKAANEVMKQMPAGGDRLALHGALSRAISAGSAAHREEHFALGPIVIARATPTVIDP